MQNIRISTNYRVRLRHNGCDFYFSLQISTIAAWCLTVASPPDSDLTACQARATVGELDRRRVAVNAHADLEFVM